MSRQLCLALVLLFCGTPVGAGQVFAGPSQLTQLAQAPANPAQPVTPATAAPDATAPAADAQAPEEPIGNVATVTGSASVIRNDTATSLKVKDDIYLNDVVQAPTRRSASLSSTTPPSISRPTPGSPSTITSMRTAARATPRSSTSPRAPQPLSPHPSPRPVT